MVVDLFERNPRWVGTCGREVSGGNRKRSKSLTAGQRTKTGRWLQPCLADLFGLRRWTTWPAGHWDNNGGLPD